MRRWNWIRKNARCALVGGMCWGAGLNPAFGAETSPTILPTNVAAVWDLSKAYHETTPTRERICLNGLWQWQPAGAESGQVPAGNWGYFKVPGCWPGITDYMQKDCQIVIAHPNWSVRRFGELTAAWYQREISVPGNWSGRRIAVSLDYMNSYAQVLVRGSRSRWPRKELNMSPLTSSRLG
jgi:hypothetical protein